MSLYDSIKLNKRRAAAESTILKKSSTAVVNQNKQPKCNKRIRSRSPVKKQKFIYMDSSKSNCDSDNESESEVQIQLADAKISKSKDAEASGIKLPQLRVVLTDISKSGKFPLAEQSQQKQNKASESEATVEKKLAALRPDCSILLPASKPHKRSDSNDCQLANVKDETNDDEFKDDVVENEDIGRLVWARWQRQSYPALVVSGRRCHLRPARPGQRWLLWLAEGKVSELPAAGLKPIDDPQALASAYTASAQRNSLLVRGVRQLRRELIERLGEQRQGVGEADDLALLAGEDEKARLQGRQRPRLSDWAADCLVDIYRRHRQSLKAVAESEGLRLAGSDSDEDNSTEFARPRSFSPSSSTCSSNSSAGPNLSNHSSPRTISDELISIYSSLADGKIPFDSVCLACGVLPNDNQPPLLEHPVLEGSLCGDCLDNYLAVCFSVGDDGWFMYCSVCARPGYQAMCGSAKCGRCFCQACLTLLIDQLAWVRITADSQWSCHLCQLRSERLIRPRLDWRERLYRQTEPLPPPPPPPPPPPLPQPPRHYEASASTSSSGARPLRVLSLFDGIASALLCLDAAGLSVEAYYASEIDPEAIRVAACNHGNRVKQLGSVTELTIDRLRAILPIDLLVGGSPCSQLSVANPNRQGLASESGLLFFEFYRILEVLNRIGNEGGGQRRSLFWLFENVASMRQEDRNTISRFLGRQPVRLDAAIFSAQRRARLFWGNLPGMTRASAIASALAADVVNCARASAVIAEVHGDGDDHCDQLGRRRHRQRHLASCIDPRSGRAARHSTVGCVTTKRSSGRGPGGSLPVAGADGLPDALWVTELERLFGFPAHYTDCGLSELARRRLLGRGWCLPVVAHLLRPLRHFFAVVPASGGASGQD